MGTKRSWEQRTADAKAKFVIATMKLEKAQSSYNIAKVKYEECVKCANVRDRIRTIQKQKGLTYEDLGEKMGVTKQRVEQKLNHNSLSAKAILQFANALGVSVEELCTETLADEIYSN